jgi:hypothetical protein
LSNDRVDGGLDLTQIISSVIRNHGKEVKGETACDDSGPRADHSSVVCEVAIRHI